MTLVLCRALVPTSDSDTSKDAEPQPNPISVVQTPTRSGETPRLSRCDCCRSHRGGAPVGGCDHFGRRWQLPRQAFARSSGDGERLDACQKFIERVRKRVTQAESAVTEAIAAKDRLVGEIQDGETRWRRLREEARVVLRATGCTGWFADARSDGRGKYAPGIAGVVSVQGPPSCDRGPRDTEGACVETLPRMPLNVQQLESWLSEWNADL